MASLAAQYRVLWASNFCGSSVKQKRNGRKVVNLSNLATKSTVLAKMNSYSKEVHPCSFPLCPLSHSHLPFLLLLFTLPLPLSPCHFTFFHFLYPLSPLFSPLFFPFCLPPLFFSCTFPISHFPFFLKSNDSYLTLWEKSNNSLIFVWKVTILTFFDRKVLICKKNCEK